jgi:hypothetical protein
MSRFCAPVVPVMIAMLLAATATELSAQAVPASLSLDEAISLARRHSPEYRIVQNQQATADWAVREAYGALVPSLRVSTGVAYQLEGTPNFGGLTGEDLGLGRTPAYYFSNYGVNLNLQLSGATFFRVSEQRANRTATEARIDAACSTLTDPATVLTETEPSLPWRLIGAAADLTDTSEPIGSFTDTWTATDFLNSQFVCFSGAMTRRWPFSNSTRARSAASVSPGSFFCAGLISTNTVSDSWAATVTEPSARVIDAVTGPSWVNSVYSFIRPALSQARA